MFSICLELGIDDPIAWMNNTPNVLVDWWISFKIHKSDKEREAYEKATGKSDSNTFSGQDTDGISRYMKVNYGR